ncbi:hypothetical protein OsJ_19077 [Oryza sativa Japonica Group]|uniref:Uncharacterized protein n=1 Tax=Oryza sativa subsp. japonica TaxID=39947 RepID=B9FKZ1_ORYSJ|nr:hypothetical protein OsJ_19077 [Oryza sativa Japonica Group]
MAGTREGSWTPERRGEERRRRREEGSWFLARSLQSVGTLHVGFSSRCSPSTSLILFSARLHTHPLDLEKTNLLLPGTLYPLLPGTLYPLQESDQDDLGNTEIIFPDYEDTLAYQVQDDADATEDDNANAERLKEMPQRRVVAVPRNKEEKEPKRQKKSVGVEGLMERYLDMRTKQTEDEAVQLAREKEAHLAREKEINDFSIKRCISVLNSMDVTKAKKVKAYTVFKNAENREIFVSACDEDPESALSWLRSEMA